MVLMLQKRERREAKRERREAGREGGEGWGRCGGNGETGRRRSSLPALPTCSPSSPLRSRGGEEVCLNSGESGSRRGGVIHVNHSRVREHRNVPVGSSRVH